MSKFTDFQDYYHEKLLSVLGASMNDFCRYRGIENYNKETSVFTVYSRDGGSNRGFCDFPIRHNPNYISDYDDSFDSTYCNIELKVPADKQKEFDALWNEYLSFFDENNHFVEEKWQGVKQ